MKKPAIIISIAFLLTIIANIGVIRCQENPNIIAEQYQQSVYTERITKKTNEDNVKDDKNIGVVILGWIIQHNLFCQYQKIDSKELEDRLERSK